MPRALRGHELTESEKEKHWLAVQRGDCLERQEERVRGGWRERNFEIKQETVVKKGYSSEQQSYWRQKIALANFNIRHFSHIHHFWVAIKAGIFSILYHYDVCFLYTHKHSQCSTRGEENL